MISVYFSSKLCYACTKYLCCVCTVIDLKCARCTVHSEMCELSQLTRQNIHCTERSTVHCVLSTVLFYYTLCISSSVCYCTVCTLTVHCATVHCVLSTALCYYTLCLSTSVCYCTVCTLSVHCATVQCVLSTALCYYTLCLSTARCYYTVWTTHFSLLLYSVYHVQCNVLLYIVY